ncbi:hypothetical protein LTR35_007756 [Friedmanniomyces endolithicus]|uniref:Zn(2)-C6 fungal-type domain-containing protein n=1 Tax=Friedmanniomyces endolithicus TaxID=329885 RepID=A0AAN6J362_9PEZI|nr:hypothetical protein LTR35_007756 [Friedmanniomyces endolithicus]KAK0282629.1 hypothetical protein LTS00_012142 [Friedmanniomyces endolithicus]KAK0312495.1 hypothetical protein LTR82_013789 [Friedmanniomyces endolithicus]KAK1006889.1 hypothetical protein LTR54_006647 [Friedmanniomyces endolithicus]
MAALLGPAVPLGFDFGLPPSEDDMTVDELFIWSAQAAHWSDVDASPLDSHSADASDWARSPGKQSVHTSNVAASSSLSPGTGSLILTPTSSNPLDFFAEDTRIERAEATGDSSTSPESSFSISSDDYNHAGHVPGQLRSARHMSNRPPSALQSGVPPLSSHPSVTNNATAASDHPPTHQWSPSVSISAVGGWMMDPSGGQWGHLDLSNFNYDLDQSVTSQSFDGDALLEINALTGVSTSGLDTSVPFRTIDNDGRFLLQNPYGPNYDYAPQALHSHPGISFGSQPVYGGQPQAYAGPSAASRAQSQQAGLRPAPTVPSQYSGMAPQHGGQHASRLHDTRSANTPSSSLPVFSSASSSRSGRRAPYPPPVARQDQVTQQTHAYQRQHLTFPSSNAAAPANRKLQPLVPGSQHATAAASTQVDRPKRGGRKKHKPLEADVREKSHIMRKTGACWRCALQRDPCPDGATPCSRCHMRSQKGQQFFFGCDRSKLPDLVYDFLPLSMTGMHQKQSIEDYVADKVARWDEDNSIDIWLTSGYGPALQWKLYEFAPKDEEPCWQLQYLQDPVTRQQVSYRKYSPPFGLLRLDLSDDTHFDAYMEQLLSPKHLWEFGWTCFEEETQVVDNFQARLLQAMCDLSTSTQDAELRELLRRVIRMMIITYIMGHTLTLSEPTAPAVLAAVTLSPKPPAHQLPTHHISPRLANRQLKFFFHILRDAAYKDLLNWQQQTLRSSPRKDASWLPAFCVTLGLAMVLEEIQRTIWIQADAKAKKDAVNVSREQAETEAVNACERIDGRFGLLVGLFQCKYRDRKWGVGSFGNQTPEVRDPVARGFLGGVMGLLLEKRELSFPAVFGDDRRAVVDG